MPVNQEKYAQLDKIIAANKGQEGAVMRTLQSAQDLFGHVPKDVQIRIAEGLGTTLSEVYGVATFYAQFVLEPQGEHVIGVCLGTACYVKGSGKIYEKLQEKLLSGVNPIMTGLLLEGIEQGLCYTDHPAEAIEMVMLYSNTAFDDLMEYSEAERTEKIDAFIYNTERLFGMECGSMRDVILPVFEKNGSL